MVRFKCSVRLDNDVRMIRKAQNAVVGVDKSGQNVSFIVKFTEHSIETFAMKERFAEVHKRFLDQGKLTVVFNSPHRKVLIQGKPQQLKILLHEMAKALPALKNELVTEAELKELKAAANSDEHVQKKIKIDSMEQYNKVRKNFPSTLEAIEIKSIGLATINMQWFSCMNLKLLHLEGNSFDKLSHIDWKIFCNISKLRNLTHLDLSNCKLRELPIKFVRSIPRFLKYLDLQSNNLTSLPEEISELRELTYFNVCKNPDLEQLPSDFFFNCQSLLIFRCLDTKIKSHPSIVREFRFQLFASSAIGRSFTQTLLPKSKPPSLLSICSSRIYDFYRLNENNRFVRTFYLLPPVIQPLVYASTFRCDICRERCPNGRVGRSLYQPLSARWIAEYVEQDEGMADYMPLLNLWCISCCRRDENIMIEHNFLRGI